MLNSDLLYQIALIQIFGIGPVTAKKLFLHFGSAKAVFEAELIDLQNCGVNKDLSQIIKSKKTLKFAEEELLFIEKYDIKTFLFNQKEYPVRLKNFDEAPFLLYFKGDTNLNATRIIAIVGTRKPTDYGLQQCEKIVQDLKPYNVMIVSGLALGIDGCAHQQSIQNEIDTIGIVAHGLDRIYPHAHKKLAQNIIRSGGGLLTEFPSGTEPVQGNFPARNRIIAGLCDALIVMETAISGGSMITANMANHYHKDVFAIPGRIGDVYSDGANQLIKTHKASLMTKVEDIAYHLRWEKKQNAVQKKMFITLSPEEQTVTNLLVGKDAVHLNHLIQESGLSNSRLASVLLEMELKAVIRALPGKYFKMA